MIEDAPDWYDVEMMDLEQEAELDRVRRQYSYIDEQIEWWKGQGIPPYEAHVACYGQAPAVTTWDTVQKRLYRDFL